MTNHFRTLILNLPPVPGGGIDFAQYIDNRFVPVSLDGPEAALRGAIMSGGTDRPRQEFLATMMFRLIMDFDTTRAIAEEVDHRLTFDPRANLVSNIPASNIPNVPEIPQIWRKARAIGGLKGLFAPTSNYGHQMDELSPLIDSLRRDDHLLAVACCAYCLRLTEKLSLS